jgi:hypothetical protein
MNRTALTSLASRAAWTFLQAGVGALIVWLSSVDVADSPGVAVALVAVAGSVLSAAKSFIASKVGDPTTVTFASTPE